MDIVGRLGWPLVGEYDFMIRGVSTFLICRVFCAWSLGVVCAWFRLRGCSDIFRVTCNQEVAHLKDSAVRFWCKDPLFLGDSVRCRSFRTVGNGSICQRRKINTDSVNLRSCGCSRVCSGVEAGREPRETQSGTFAGRTTKFSDLRTILVSFGYMRSNPHIPGTISSIHDRQALIRVRLNPPSTFTIFQFLSISNSLPHNSSVPREPCLRKDCIARHGTRLLSRGFC